MVAAYTFYKFREVVIIVFSILLILAIGSQIPSQNDIILITGHYFADVVASNELKTSVDLAENMNNLNPKTGIQKSFGTYLYELLIDNPGNFIYVVLFLSGLFFVCGVHLKSLRYLRRFV